MNGNPGGGQFHAGRQAALHDGDITGGEMQMKIGDVAMHLDTSGTRQAVRVDSRAGDDREAQPRHGSPCRGGFDDMP